jgi:DNA-binding GntR family transcriptional regulator
VDHQGLAARVYGHVKARILLGDVRPGDIIAAHALAAELQVSRTPVHEGLKRLVGEGYLVTQPRVGYAVTPINLDEMRDLFQVRTRLESLAAELAALNWSEAHLAAFEEADRSAQRRYRELTKKGTAAEVAQHYNDEHKRFHRMIGDVAGNRRLGRLIDDLQDETQRFWSLVSGRMASAVFLADPGHRAILDAIATGDPVKARASIVTHMQEGVRAMLESVVPEALPEDDITS